MHLNLERMLLLLRYHSIGLMLWVINWVIRWVIKLGINLPPVQNNNITKMQLQEKTSKSKTTVDNTISFLREHGLIERIGSNKTGYWKVND